MAEENPKSRKPEITVAIIGVIGVITAALIANIDKWLPHLSSNTNVNVSSINVSTPPVDVSTPQIKDDSSRSKNNDLPATPKKKENPASKMVGVWQVDPQIAPARLTNSSDGTFEYQNENGETDSGEWTYSGNIYTQKGNNEIAKGKVKWIDNDAFELSVIEINGYPVSYPAVRFNRIERDN